MATDKRANIESMFANNAQLVESLIKALTAGPSSSGYRLVIEHMRHFTKEYQKYWYHALKQCVSLISDTNHTDLFTLILIFDWSSADQDTISAYTEFLFHLGAAQQTLVRKLYKSIARNFRLENLRTCPDSQRVVKSLHHAINGLLTLVPSSRLELIPAINEFSPSIFNSAEMIHQYLENVLLIPDYCPSLRGAVLEFVINKMLPLDVEINFEEVPDEFMFQLEDEKQKPEEKLNTFASRLDDLMELMFSYIDRCHHKENQEIMDLFEALLKIFDNYVIKTPKSKFVQYLMFYITRLDTSYQQQFLSYLLNKMMSSTNHINLRHSAVIYIASYISRATFLSPQIAKSFMLRLAESLHQYLDARPIVRPDLDTHRLFYAGCQCIMYTVRFISQPGSVQSFDKNFFKLLKLERLLTSPLAPLRFIIPDIIDEFGNVASTLGLSSCTEIVEQFKNSPHLDYRIYSNPLSTFFPFEPYILKNSAKYVEPYYRVFKATISEENGNQSQESEEDINSPSRRINRRSRSGSVSEQSMSIEHSHSPSFSFQSPGGYYGSSLDVSY